MYNSIKSGSPVFSKVLIVGPGFEQRISKMAYAFKMRNIKCDVIAEEAEVSEEFKNYIEGIKFIKIPINEKLKRTPLGIRRITFLKKLIINEAMNNDKLLVIARDVNYGFIVSYIIRKIKLKNITLLTDVADNYDLLYASMDNLVKKIIIKLGFSLLTNSSFKNSDGLIVVAPVNENRIKSAYPWIKNKPIYLLRNLPLSYKYIKADNKMPDSIVYVGKIDEISRDPIYIIENLKDLSQYSLHFYSSQKRATLDKIQKLASEYGMTDRIVFHERVSYDQLPYEICKYEFGLVPHKRSPITDYTVPNKIYDYKSSGVITIMSDCPSLIYENNEFGFGVVYSKENNDFKDVLHDAKSYKLDFSVELPTWDNEFEKMITELEALFDGGENK